MNAHDTQLIVKERAEMFKILAQFSESATSPLHLVVMLAFEIGSRCSILEAVHIHPENEEDSGDSEAPEHKGAPNNSEGMFS